MSDSEQEQGKESRSTETKRFWIVASRVYLFGFSAVNIFLLLVVSPKFEQIFQDSLPGKPLPTVTEFILTARMALVFIALGWPILGALLIRQQKPSAILWINVGIVWTFLQFAITVIALFVPFFMPAGGMSDMPDHNP
jgi:hypothetical protein